MLEILNQLSIDQLKFLTSLAQASGTVLAALIIGIAGGLIAGHYNKKRDSQDKESQWRNHAIELTKLDLDGKLKAYRPEKITTIRPSILDFLANYRDLMELGEKTPKELYAVILDKRINKKDQDEK